MTIMLVTHSLREAIPHQKMFSRIVDNYLVSFRPRVAFIRNRNKLWMKLHDYKLLKGTVSLDNPTRFLRITIGSRGEVVVNNLIFAGIQYRNQIKLPTLLAIEPEQ